MFAFLEKMTDPTITVRIRKNFFTILPENIFRPFTFKYPSRK